MKTGKHSKLFLTISLSINMIFIISILFLIYLKKDSIIRKIDSFYSFTDNKDFQKKISVMNRTSSEMVVEGEIESKFNKHVKFLIIGNSITYHPISNNIGWDHESGMAATALNKDYVHLLLTKISQKKKCKIYYKIKNLAEFERNLLSFDFNTIHNLVEFKPDFVIFQLGENVSVESIEEMNLFEVQYKKLISNFPKSKKVITTPFFPSPEKNLVIRQVASDSKGILVDLSHLVLLDKKNFAKNEKNYSNDGVGKHPGDIGMENISELIFIALNSCID